MANDHDLKKFGKSYARYSGLVFQMIIIILIGVFGGSKLDSLFQFQFPVLTLILTILAVILAFYLFFKEVIKQSKTKD